MAITPGKNVTLSPDENIITVKVTAEDGEATSTYTVTVTRAEKSEISTLRGISLSGVTLIENFFPTYRSCTRRSVDNSVSSTTVRVSKTNAQSTVVITPADGDSARCGPPGGLDGGYYYYYGDPHRGNAGERRPR